MRLYKFLFGTSSFLAVASSALGIANEEKATASASFELFENYILEILEDLSTRGHSTFYITRDDQAKFAKNHPSVNVHRVGPATDPTVLKNAVQDLRELNFAKGLKHLVSQMTDTFAEEYTKIGDFIDTNDIDVAICDALSSSCVKASLTAGIPFIVTSSLPQGKDAQAPYINNDMFNMRNPTTEFMPFKERLHDMFIKPLQIAFSLREVISRQNQVLMSLGITPAMQPHEKWVNSIKMFNSAFGFEQGRPVGPLVELIGPIVPRVHSALIPEIQQFLDNHKRVVYGAFGQHAWSTEADGRLIMTTLLETLEAGEVNGIVWASRNLNEMFPVSITTSSNTAYDIQGFYNNREKEGPILFLDWAPQVAILNHPSTSVFVTHGGAGSLYGSMYAGVRLVILPIFDDQPGAAITAEKNGVGLKLDNKKSQQDANEVVSRVAKDIDGKFQSNTNRFKALVQTRSKIGVNRGANLVEEVLFMHVDGGKIPHRYDVRRNVSFFKVNNLDIYAFILVLVVCAGYGVWSFFSFIITLSSEAAKNAGSHEKKLK